jgi:hypothetical protein
MMEQQERLRRPGRKRLFVIASLWLYVAMGEVYCF